MVVEKVFAVIAESTRRDILEALAQESKAVGQLVDELGVSQPTVSKHLRVLREAGVVSMRAQGQKRFYGINTEPLALVSAWLESLGAGINELSAPVAVQQDDTVKPAAAAARPDARAAIKPVAVKVAAPSVPVAQAKPAAVAPSSVRASAPGTAPAAAAKLGAAASAAASVPTATVAGSGSPATPPVTAPATSAGAAPAARPGTGAPAARQVAVVAPIVGSDGDGGVPRQLGRSVGRAAKKGADLLATFKRRKD